MGRETNKQRREKQAAGAREKAAAARELVAGILERMGVKAELSVEDKADGIHLSVKASLGGEALGAPRGGVVESITYLVNKAINRDEEGRKWVYLHLLGEPAGTEAAPVSASELDPAARAVAEELAQKAKSLGGALWVGPLPGGVRALQAALSATAGVRVRAEGEGIHRRLLVEAS